MNKTFICSICGRKCEGYGNNPYPVTKGENDRCCDDCNAEQVIPARLRDLESPEDYCWRTGSYLSDCDCEMCDHKYECAGYEGDENE